MRRLTFFLLFISISHSTYSQTAADLFNGSDTKISWLGIDYSQVKLIGDFAQFYNAGDKSMSQLRDEYFAGWNKLVLREPDKYDIKGMLRKGDIYIDIGMVMDINSKAKLENIEAYNNPNYDKAFIDSVVVNYPIEGKTGIGIMFIAESLNKNAVEAYYHFVALNMTTKEVLIQERFRSQPAGFGLRNYWAGSLYKVIKYIRSNQYNIWRNTYK